MVLKQTSFNVPELQCCNMSCNCVSPSGRWPAASLAGCTDSRFSVWPRWSPPPLVGARDIYARVCVLACVSTFPRYLWCALMDFHQAFGSNAYWERDELIRFWDQRIKGQNQSMTKYAKILFSGFVSMIFSKLLLLAHLGPRMNCLVLEVKRSEVKVTAWQNVLKIPDF